MTFATVTLTRGDTHLVGYMMEDGTFQFLIRGKMRTFPTLMDAWSAWANA